MKGREELHTFKICIFDTGFEESNIQLKVTFFVDFFMSVADFSSKKETPWGLLCAVVMPFNKTLFYSIGFQEHMLIPR